MSGLAKPAKALLAAALILVTGACAHSGAEMRTDVDPWEPFNRSMYRFNESLDRVLIEPVARGYKAVIPSGARKGVGNVFRNLGEPTTIVNDLLQGKGNQAAHDFMRFVVNSTFGLFGWFDLATPLGMERNEEDFGQTFSVWGVPRGPYLVLPLVGPSTVTDGAGLIPSTLYTDPRTAAGNTAETWAILAVDVVDTRARLLGASRVLDLQLDPYVFRRESYLQRREQLVNDAESSVADEDDFFDEEYLDEDLD